MLSYCKHPNDPSALQQDWTLSGRLVEGGESRSIPLFPLPFRVGRRSEVALTLSRPTVSGAHAEFFLKERKLILRDLKSTNGTFVNGDRLAGEREVKDNDLIQFADVPFRLQHSSMDSPSQTLSTDACKRAMVMVQFDHLITGKAVIPHFQPIVELTTGRFVAYESLARSRLVGLEMPLFMFAAAEELGLTNELTQVLRRVAVEESALFGNRPHLFLNTHPCELESVPALLRSCAELRTLAPHQPITIEIHEGAIAQVDEMVALCHGLQDLDMTLAFDDFGAGQARIVELAEVRPQYIKFDRSMIKDLHTADPSRRQVVASLVKLSRDVGAAPLAEGVETREERDACIEAGFVYSQGYFHGKPLPAAQYIERQLKSP